MDYNKNLKRLFELFAEREAILYQLKTGSLDDLERIGRLGTQFGRNTRKIIKQMVKMDGQTMNNILHWGTRKKKRTMNICLKDISKN